MKILFWDIDGTLIKTGRAGLYALDEAMQDLWRQSVDFGTVQAAGMTDYHIAAQLIEKVAGRPARQEEMDRLVSRYEELLSLHLSRREGVVLPQVREILEHLDGRDGYKSLLLTGNGRTGAALKLQRFGLEGFFDFDNSAFCRGHLTRDEIAGLALPLARSLAADRQHHIFVIGDTPNDIRCGKQIGAYTIGVGTGGYGTDMLWEHGPWWAVNELPQPDEFLAKLDSAS